MVNYLVGDFLIRLRNAALAKNKSFLAVSNKEVMAIAEKLTKLGFVSEVKKEKEGLVVTLAFKDKKPRIVDLKLVSKPGLRIYTGVSELEEKKGPSVYLISTPKGILSSREAIKERTGGEVIAKIT